MSLDDLDLPPAACERQVLGELRRLAASNVVAEPMIGLGYSGTVTPGVIRRNILESPAWYTAYTPYQPEISQGRLEALLNFQTMVSDLTGLDTANASLLDEGTAVAEAVTLMRRRSQAVFDRVVVDADCHPQTLAVLETRLAQLGIELAVVDLDAGPPEGDYFGIVQQYPGSSGAIRDFAEVTEAAHARGRARHGRRGSSRADLVAAPGGVGRRRRRRARRSDSAYRCGTAAPTLPSWRSRLGSSATCPADWSACRSTPRSARLTGSALQTREQHIRREKATSNICTAQVLLAVVAGMYAVYHGPDGLRGIAQRVHRRTVGIAQGLEAEGFALEHRSFFDTIVVRVPGRAAEIVAAARRRRSAAAPGRRRPRRHLVRRDDNRGPRDRRPQGLRGADRRSEPTRRDALPECVAAARARSSPTPCSPSTTPRRRCCDTSGNWRTGTSRSTRG